MIALVGLPAHARCAWKQFRALGLRGARRCATSRPAGSTATSTPCRDHAPWDYLGGYLACIEAGAVVATRPATSS